MGWYYENKTQRLGGPWFESRRRLNTFQTSILEIINTLLISIAGFGFCKSFNSPPILGRQENRSGRVRSIEQNGSQEQSGCLSSKIIEMKNIVWYNKKVSRPFYKKLRPIWRRHCLFKYFWFFHSDFPSCYNNWKSTYSVPTFCGFD